MKHVEIEIDGSAAAAAFGLPEGLVRRLHALLDKQDCGDELDEDERAEAEGLADVADFLSLHRLRNSRACYSRDMMNGDDLLADALRLPPGERARIAHELLESLDEGEDPDVAGAWHAEIERRVQAVEEGTAVLEDWTSVRARLATRRAQRRAG